METNYSGKKIGLLGGSFDPIHQGHLNIAKRAQAEFDLDEVWFIPAGHSPNKNESDMTDAETRADMVAHAIEPYPQFKLLRIELEHSGTSYTYLTLSKLSEQYPHTQFYFIMGADSLAYFEKWCHPEIICQKAVILCAVRDDMDVAEIENKISVLKKLFEAEIYPICGGRTEVSSTSLRVKIAMDSKKPELLPESVWEYIISHGLYECHLEE